jgi:hypothetical protein
VTPTEHEGTVAVDAAARKLWELQEQAVYESTGGKVRGPSYDQLKQLKKNEVRQSVLPIVWAALEALPDRRADGWDEGYRSGFSNAMRRMSDEPDAPETPNPYREAEGG